MASSSTWSYSMASPMSWVAVTRAAPRRSSAGEGIQVALPAPGVQAGVGLVEQDEVGPACQHLGEVDALALPA